MAQVRWTVGALADLRELGRSLARGSVVYSAMIVEQLLSATSRLEDFPAMGRIVPEYESHSIRELIVSSFRIVYLLEDNEQHVRIASVTHGSRDLVGHLGLDPHDLP